jgi:hypothetical protein
MLKNVKGSALVFSLVVLSMILVAALGVAAVSVVEKKNSLSTGKSTQAFQLADSAIEMVLKKAVINPQLTLGALGDGWQCGSGGVVTVPSLVGISGNPVVLTFKKEVVTDIVDCNTKLSEVADVKATGQYGSTTRAINTVVAAGTLKWYPIDGTYSNGFSSMSGSDAASCAKDDRTGILYLKGGVNRGGTNLATTGRDIALVTLPSECVPSAMASKSMMMPIGLRGQNDNHFFGWLHISTTGVMTFADTDPIEEIYFSGIAIPTN